MSVNLQNYFRLHVSLSFLAFFFKSRAYVTLKCFIMLVPDVVMVKTFPQSRDFLVSKKVKERKGNIPTYINPGRVAVPAKALYLG